MFNPMFFVSSSRVILQSCPKGIYICIIIHILYTHKALKIRKLNIKVLTMIITIVYNIDTKGTNLFYNYGEI